VADGSSEVHHVHHRGPRNLYPAPEPADARRLSWRSSGRGPTADCEPPISAEMSSSRRATRVSTGGYEEQALLGHDGHNASAQTEATSAVRVATGCWCSRPVRSALTNATTAQHGCVTRARHRPRSQAPTHSQRRLGGRRLANRPRPSLFPQSSCTPTAAPGGHHGQRSRMVTDNPDTPVSSRSRPGCS
jgi:hypothetical protein